MDNNKQLINELKALRGRLSKAHDRETINEVVRVLKENDRTIEGLKLKADRVLVVLSHTLKEADGWYDDCRGGKIEGNSTIDEARALVAPLVVVGMDLASGPDQTALVEADLHKVEAATIAAAKGVNHG